MQKHLLLAIAGLALTLSPAVDAQKRKQPSVDPYTKDEDELIEKAGYVGMGHMTWSDRHDTRRIEEDLGKVKFVWIETPHFKLGCSLNELPMPRDKKRRTAMKAELEELAKTLPNLKVRRVKKLDRWLRAHLYAKRLETLYARVLELTGTSQQDFPGDDAPRWPFQRPEGTKWMGRGPHLGMKGKYLVLLCQKQTSCARYLSTYTKADATNPARWYFEETDTFLFSSATEFGENAYADPLAMHAHVTFNVAQNLLDGFKGYSYLLPAWWKEGLSHQLRREITTEFNDFSGFNGDKRRAYTITEWRLKVWQRLRHDLIKPWEKHLDVTDPTGFTLVDHMAAWSRVHWLMSEHDGECIQKFIDAMKGFHDARGMPPTAEFLLKHQRKSLEDAFKKSVDELDADWMDWVRKTYPRK